MAIRKILLPGRDDQQVMALIVLVFLVGASLYFWQRSVTNSGLIDFEDLPSRQVEYLVDINKANWPELANLPGIGEKLAKQIVRYREQHGPFATTDQLLNIFGIGEVKLSNMHPYIFVSDTSNSVGVGR